MTNSQRLAMVRDHLTQWIAEQADESVAEQPSPDAPAHPDLPESGGPIRAESILIRDGFYCGRRFDLGSYRAVWFLEQDELKIYAAGGDLACVFCGDEITAGAGNAAASSSEPDEAAATASEAAVASETGPVTETGPSNDRPDVIALPSAPAANDESQIRRAA